MNKEQADARFPSKFNPFKADYRQTAHDFATISRTGEFHLGSTARVNLSGHIRAAEANRSMRVDETPYKKKRYSYEPNDYPDRASSAVLHSHGFIALPNIHNS